MGNRIAFSPLPGPSDENQRRIGLNGGEMAFPPGPTPSPTVFTPNQTISNELEVGYSFGAPHPPSTSHDVPEPIVYKPVAHHWFYRKAETDIWKPFSAVDSSALEGAYSSNSATPVSVEGGRFDVDVGLRLCSPVYWEDTDVTHVQRCSWFYKGPMDNNFIPYSEKFSKTLEEEFELAVKTNTRHKRLELGSGEAVVFHNVGYYSFDVVHFCRQASADEWGSIPELELENQLRPRSVKRGVEGTQLPAGESPEIDHLVFLVHGIGSFCDFKFRTVVETVDDFRALSSQLLQTHFKEATGRIEFLPVQWHKALHGDGGIDEKLKPISLKSIPKLRHFTNDTLLDILFYTSPVYCQTIMDTVGSEMNRMYNMFLDRNPTFNCLSVAVAGHSLGSLILFDLLAHQPEIVQSISQVEESTHSSYPVNQTSSNGTGSNSDSKVKGKSSRMVSYTVGSAGTGQPYINYPILDFHPNAFFAMGSPIAMFVTVRGLDKLGEDFHFPTCPAFFNIFHPFDPVAYRIESLIDPTLDLRPVLIPHHKGRKRFHLELKETISRVGADFKNKVLESIRLTWNTVSQLTSFTGSTLEQEVDKAIATEFDAEDESFGNAEKDIRIGSLNSGRRIDYVLQEAPHQILNEYLFALSSHVCYWESDDTVLLIMNELLNQGLSPSPSPGPDTAQNTNTWPSVPPCSSHNEHLILVPANDQGSAFASPTANSQTIGPPPMRGFVRKS